MIDTRVEILVAFSSGRGWFLGRMKEVRHRWNFLECYSMRTVDGCEENIDRLFEGWVEYYRYLG